MQHKATEQFGFKPGGLGRHHAAIICNSQHIIHMDRLHGERSNKLAGIHTGLQVTQRPCATQILQAWVTTGGIRDAQHSFKDRLLEKGYVKGGNPVCRRVHRAGEFVPGTVHIHMHHMDRRCRLRKRRDAKDRILNLAVWLHGKGLGEPCHERLGGGVVSEIPHQSAVTVDLHPVLGKDNGHKPL